MAGMQKRVCTWAGFTGAPGYTTFYFKGDTLQSEAQLTNLFAAVAGNLPPSITITIPNTGELVDPSTGEVTGTWTVGTQAVVTGTGTTALVPTSGPQVRWTTGQFRRGHQVRGRTYFIPINAAAFATNGVIAATLVSGIQTAANNLINGSSGMFGVWHRPLKDYSVKPPILKDPGEWIPVTTATALAKPASLTSRRD